MVTRYEILATARSRSGETQNGRPTVRDVMKTDFPAVAPAADLFSDGYHALQEGELRAIPVLQTAGSPVCSP